MPVFGIGTNAFTVDENKTEVGTVTATDADANTTLTYALSGTDAASFNLDSATGALEFKTAPDFETDASSYSVVVTVNDGVDTVDQTVTITLRDLNDELQVFTSNATFTLDENQTAVGTVTATDADANSTITYALGGTDAASFNLDSPVVF